MMVTEFPNRETVRRESPAPESALTAVAPRIFQRGKIALDLLLEARRFADDLDRSSWDFALEIEQMRSAGLLHNDLRWLICKGYLEQASEIPGGGDQERCFQQQGPLTFTETSCFVLTDEGYQTLQQQLTGAALTPGTSSCLLPPWEKTDSESGAETMRDAHGLNGRGPSPADPLDRELRPYWDRDRQELRLGNRVVKQFKVPAPNQEMVIAVFQEEGWPVRIDDPLPPRSDLEPKRRLHDTINSLNRNQKSSLIRFLGDGSGQGVRWERVDMMELPSGERVAEAWR